MDTFRRVTPNSNEYPPTTAGFAYGETLKIIPTLSSNDPHREKTGFLDMRKQRLRSDQIKDSDHRVTAKLISAFVFATQIVQFLFFLYTKIQASSHLVWSYSLVCVGPGLKPRRQVFSRGSSSGLMTCPSRYIARMK